jgi:hypothetical protein
MAGLAFDVNIPSKALTAATPTCIGFLTAPSNQRVKMLGYGFYFDGTSNSAQPVEIKLARPTAGVFTPGGTAIKCDAGLSETVQSVVGLSASTEPTLTASLVNKTITVHPQLGYEYLAPLGQEEMIAGGTNFVFSANAPAAVNIRGYLKFEE